MNTTSATTNNEAIFAPARMARSFTHAALVFAISLFTTITAAQAQPETPPKTLPPPPTMGAYDSLYRAGLVCGAGASNSPIATKPTAQCGAIFSMAYFDFETGFMGPQANRGVGSGYLSTNFLVPLLPVKESSNNRGVPLVVGGYTRMFETGHAIDYGLAYAHPISDSNSVQFEVRDYWAFSNPSQHNIVFRVVWLVGLPD